MPEVLRSTIEIPIRFMCEHYLNLHLTYGWNIAIRQEGTKNI